MSDKVVVLSKRPAVVRHIFDLKEFSGLTPMERRSHDHFKTYFNQIWKELDISA